MTDPLDPLLDLHEDFDERLHRHQEALVRQELTVARDEIERLRDDLRSHAEDEERLLLPVLEEHGGWTRIGHPDYYRQDHAKLHSMLDELCRRTAALSPEDPGLARAIARLLVGQHKLETLLEHHDERERKGLYTDLLRMTTAEQRTELHAAFRPLRGALS